MDLPVIDTPVFPRWVWMEEITYSHIPIATLVTAFMLLAPLFEYIGYRRKDLRWERLAKSFIWFSLILFSPGAALGTGIPMFIIGTYPEFWSRWANLFYWPLIVQFGFFLAEVFFLFFFYYLTWDAWQNRKKLHITMGVIAAFFGYMVQVVWDSLGAYMLTPGNTPLPQVTEPVAWSLPAMLNPSFPFLLSHRTFGNFSYVLLLTGGVFALRYRGQKRKDPNSENTTYFRWASQTCFLIGFFAFFAQPIIGWFYARVIQREAPAAFLAIMGGHSNIYFIIKMSLILFLLVVGGTFVVKRHGSKKVMWGATAGLLVVLLVVWLHPPLMWLAGSAVLWRLVSTAVILGLIGWLWWQRGTGNPERNAWQWAMFAVGLAAFFTFAMGGFVREHSKSPDTVYGEIVKPEQTQEEADRYLVYTKWLEPRGLYPSRLDEPPPEGWRQAVQTARDEGVVELTDDEAQRIIGFLEENHP
ncbi:MAG: cytochrome ubiquinol oxidase subunit I [Sedimentisphaerales bacterium]|nr:cytochrome ubiquinol oxidase subunit I [Sedimentisphaerales bacterium]